MPVSPKFNFKQLEDLSTDFKKSVKSLPVITKAVVRQHIRPMVVQLRRQFAKDTGDVRRTFGYSIKDKRGARGTVSLMVGLFTPRRASVGAIIAGNVQQHPGAVARKGKYLWIPFPGTNRAASGEAAIDPNQFRGMGGFVRRSQAGNMIAFIRQTGGVAVPMFILKRSIEFKKPPVPFEDRTEAKVPEIIEDIPEMVAQLIEARRLAGVV